MANKFFQITTDTLAVSILLLFLPNTVLSVDEIIPADPIQLNPWFDRQVGPSRPTPLLEPLAKAEASVTVITVNAAGGGDFKTVSEAVNSIPTGNKNRVIVSIASGNYSERIKIERNKPFVTLHGDPTNPPVLVSSGTALEYGTVDSATVIAEGDHFSAVNIHFVNSAPRPDGTRKLEMAVALRVSGEYATIYNCRIYGYQDTLCDDKGKHLFKDCYIEGTIDFIFGSGKSIYLNTEIHALATPEKSAIITAQARKGTTDPDGYVFVHCKVTGSGGTAYLGRAWFATARVVFAYSEMSDAVLPEGWSNNRNTESEKTLYFGEYNNKGPGGNFATRAPFTKKLSDAEAQQFLSLAFVEGGTWVLPPAKVTGKASSRKLLSGDNRSEFR